MNGNEHSVYLAFGPRGVGAVGLDGVVVVVVVVVVYGIVPDEIKKREL